MNAILPISFLSSMVKPFGGNEKDEGTGIASKDLEDNLTDISPIDNFSIVRQRPVLAAVLEEKVRLADGGGSPEVSSVLTTATVPVLSPGLDISTQLELIPPDVYKTLFLWYGGGPQV